MNWQKSQRKDSVISSFNKTAYKKSVIKKNKSKQVPFIYFVFVLIKSVRVIFYINIVFVRHSMILSSIEYRFFLSIKYSQLNTVQGTNLLCNIAGDFIF